MNTAEKGRILERSAVFSAIPRAELSVLAEMMRTEAFAGGGIVMEAGEEATGIAVVADGTLAVFLPPAPELVRRLGIGEVLGEYGMLAASVRTATVRAETDSVLLSLDYERFRAYLLRFPEALWVLFEDSVKRLLEVEARVK